MASIKQKLAKKARDIKKNIDENNERGARRAVLEDLFYDLHRSRAQVYKMNFIRGIMLGAGTVIGGTVLIALLIWTLSLLGNVIPPLGDFFDGVTNTIEEGSVGER